MFLIFHYYNNLAIFGKNLSVLVETFVQGFHVKHLQQYERRMSLKSH